MEMYYALIGVIALLIGIMIVYVSSNSKNLNRAEKIIATYKPNQNLYESKKENEKLKGWLFVLAFVLVGMILLHYL